MVKDLDWKPILGFAYIIFLFRSSRRKAVRNIRGDKIRRSNKAPKISNTLLHRR
jgi:hypothetical protein